jgi:hypothetical protein
MGMRCLERFVAREVYQALTNPPKDLPTGHQLRRLRLTAGHSLTTVSNAIGTIRSGSPPSNAAWPTTLHSPDEPVTGSSKMWLDIYRSFIRPGEGGRTRQRTVCTSFRRSSSGRLDSDRRTPQGGTPRADGDECPAEVSRDLVTESNDVDAVHHGVDVPQHFCRGDVRRIVAELSRGLRSQQAPCPDLQPFNPQGGD